MAPIVLDPAALIDDYLQHRADREAQVLAAAATGPDHRRRDCPAPLHAAHPSVVRAAADSVLADLIKLRDEGRAEDENGEWRVR